MVVATGNEPIGISHSGVLPVMAMMVLVSLGTDGHRALADQGMQAPPEKQPRLALLVGVESYPKLKADRQLAGCRNDVRGIAGLLTERFGFSASDIEVLVDEQATAAAIRQGWQRLVQRIDKLPTNGLAPQVVFYFSGHGSQMPDQAEGAPDCDEEDGLDETLVTFDSGQEGGPEDLRDDEVYQFVEAVVRGGRARVLVVLDCCHAGSGARAAGNLRQIWRQVTPAQARSGGARSVTPKRLPGGAIVLAACRSTEVEPEYPLGEQTYGLMTGALLQVLCGTPEISRLSYQLLRERIVQQYQRQGIIAPPTPQLEGSPEDFSRTFLGVGTEADRSPTWKVDCLGPDRCRVRLEAGALHGITRGSLLELYASDTLPGSAPLAGAAGKGIGWLEVKQVGPLTAMAEVFRWSNADPSDKDPWELPASIHRGLAVERYHEPGQLGARIGVESARSGVGVLLKRADGDVPPAVRRVLSGVGQSHESPWISWVDAREECDLVLRIEGKQAAIFAASGEVTPAAGGRDERAVLAPSLRGGWGPFDLESEEEAARQIQACLRRIVRTRNLIRATALANGGRGEIPAVQLELVEVELDRQKNIASLKPRQPDAGGAIQVHRGEYLAFRAAHKVGVKRPVYGTVLVIDPQMEIQAVLPEQAALGDDQEQSLVAGQQRLSAVYRATEPLGTHWAIALVTWQPNDLFLLAQPGVPQVRGAATRSPLVSWLMDQATLRATKRPRSSAEDALGAMVLRWEVVP